MIKRIIAYNILNVASIENLIYPFSITLRIDINNKYKKIANIANVMTPLSTVSIPFKRYIECATLKLSANMIVRIALDI